MGWKLKKALSNGLIRTSSSPYGSLVFLVSKKKGTLQLFTNYRALKAATVKKKYPFLSLKSSFKTFWKPNYLSRLILQQAIIKYVSKRKTLQRPPVVIHP